MASRRIQVEIVGDASSLQKAFGSAGKQASGFGDKIGKASKVAVGALAALGVGAKIGFDELAESQRVGAQTDAALKSTAGAANVTKASIESLAGAISRKSGIDDEAIQSGQNLLLTFTNLRNETGKGNDIFNQATRVMADMSTALGQDMKSSAIQLGKALNDPIKGVTALQRVGVSFTAQQKDQIKALVESGNAMGAQKLILAELNKEFGGSAEAAGKTLTGSLNKARNAFEEMAAQIVSALLPTLTRLAEAVGRVSAFLTQHQKAVQIAGVALAAISGVVLAVNGAMKALAAVNALASVAFIGLGSSATIADKAMRLTMIGGLVTLAGALVVAYQKSETFREVVAGAVNAVKAAFLSFSNVYLTIVDKFLGGLQAMANGASKLPFVGDKFKGVADAIGGAREQVQGLQAAINGLKSKEINVTTTFTQVYRQSGVPVAGSRAHGGPVTRGSTYLVGEKGPELFTASHSGTIIPNSGSGAGIAQRAPTVHNHFSFPNYLGDKREMIETLRGEFLRIQRRGSSITI